MPRPEQVAQLAREVAALSGSDRRAVLRTLTAAERRMLKLAEAPEHPVTPAEDAHSAWFDALLAAARAGEGPATPQASRALLSAMPSPDADSRPARSRSLLDVASGVLSRPKSRP